MVNCEFSEPVNLGEITHPDWEYSKIVCSGSFDFSTSGLPVYISTTTDDFYIQKTFTYGEIILLSFLIPAIIIVLVFGIRKILIHKFLNG